MAEEQSGQKGVVDDESITSWEETLSPREMDERLLTRILSFSSDGHHQNCNLPMDAWMFYSSFIYEQGVCDVQLSSYKNVSKWLHAMEHLGYIETRTKCSRPMTVKKLRKNPSGLRKFRQRSVSLGQRQGRPIKTIIKILGRAQNHRDGTPQQEEPAENATKGLERPPNDLDLQHENNSDLETVSMDETLRLRLECVANTCQIQLPMDTSLFYQNYVLNQNGRCDVKQSSYRTVSAWLQAMQDRQLVVLQKHQQSARNYRKKASSKVIVALGKEDVARYQLRQQQRRLPRRDTSIPSSQETFSNNQSHTSPIILETDTSPSPLPSASKHDVQIENSGLETTLETTEKDMDEMIRDCLNRIPQQQLPKDLGNFYQRFMLPLGCNVRESPFKTVSEWLHVLEKQELVLLKRKHMGGKNTASTKVVVAAGKEAVDRMLGNARNLQSREESEGLMDDGVSSPNCRLTNADLLCDEMELHIQGSKHGKDRQKHRTITNSDIESVLLKKGSRVCRSGNGKKTYTDNDNGITAIVTGRKKKYKVVTAWREDIPVIKQRKERCSHTADDTCNLKEMNKQNIVTVSETYARYLTGSKWKEGALVRKNKRYRVVLLLVGLREDLVAGVAKQIRNQVGCPCTVGKLKYSEWYSLHDQIDPMAAEGSKTVSLSLAAENQVISKVLKHVEAVIPQKSLRYLRENLKEAQKGNRLIEEVVKEDSNQEMIDEQAVAKVREGLLELYRVHAPEKIADLDDLLKKYSGIEEQLLHAVREKYAKKENSNDACANKAVGNTGHSTVNVEDLMGAFDWDDLENEFEAKPRFREEEDMSIYF